MTYTLVCVAAAIFAAATLALRQKAVLHSVEIRCKIIETPPRKRLYTNNLFFSLSAAPSAPGAVKQNYRLPWVLAGLLP